MQTICFPGDTNCILKCSYTFTNLTFLHPKSNTFLPPNFQEFLTHHKYKNYVNQPALKLPVLKKSIISSASIITSTYIILEMQWWSSDWNTVIPLLNGPPLLYIFVKATCLIPNKVKINPQHWMLQRIPTRHQFRNEKSIITSCHSISLFSSHVLHNTYLIMSLIEDSIDSSLLFIYVTNPGKWR